MTDKTIVAALEQLDPQNDEHWTADGAPRVDFVSGIVGSEVKRQQITDAAPGLTRDALASAVDEVADDPPPDEEGSKEAPASEFDPSQMLGKSMSLLTPEERDTLEDWLHAQIEEINAECSKLNVEIATLKDRRKRLGKEVTNLGSRLAWIDRQKGDPTARALRNFLQGQKKARAEKAERAKAFLNAGTTADAVRKSLQTKAPIDQAMSARRATPGSARPNHPHRH